MNKTEIRTFVKAKKQELSKEEIKNRSLLLSEKFLNLPSYKDSEVVYVYASYNQEIDTSFIMERAWADGKVVAAPKVLDDGLMEFYEINSFDDLEKGYCGIPEPKSCAKIAKHNNILLLMPGLAFDKTGNRIGYGGGFYDRYLERYASCNIKTVALAYDFQIFENLEVEEFDKKVDIIINL